MTAQPPPAECSCGYQPKGDGVLVLDAGAGTIDICSYNISQWSPVTMEEMNIPESPCIIPRLSVLCQTDRSLEQSGLVLGSHVLAVKLRAILDRNQVLPICWHPLTLV